MHVQMIGQDEKGKLLLNIWGNTQLYCTTCRCSHNTSHGNKTPALQPPIESTFEIISLREATKSQSSSHNKITLLCFVFPHRLRQRYSFVFHPRRKLWWLPLILRKITKSGKFANENTRQTPQSQKLTYLWCRTLLLAWAIAKRYHWWSNVLCYTCQESMQYTSDTSDVQFYSGLCIISPVALQRYVLIQFSTSIQAKR